MTEHQPIFSRPRSWAVVFFVLLAAGPAWIAWSRPDDTLAIPPAPRAGAPAPAFSAATLDGESVALADLRGQVVVLNLWASWCAPCRAEMPALERVWQRYVDDGLVVLAVNQGEDAATIEAFVAEYDLSFPIALDPREQVGRQYELVAYPTTLFIDRDGVVRNVVRGGPMPEALVESQVKALLD